MDALYATNQLRSDTASKSVIEAWCVLQVNQLADIFAQSLAESVVGFFQQSAPAGQPFSASVPAAAPELLAAAPAAIVTQGPASKPLPLLAPASAPVQVRKPPANITCYSTVLQHLS